MKDAFAWGDFVNEVREFDSSVVDRSSGCSLLDGEEVEEGVLLGEDFGEGLVGLSKARMFCATLRYLTASGMRELMS